MRRRKRGELASYSRNSTEGPRLHLKDNWVKTDPAYVDASIRACMERLQQGREQQVEKAHATYRAAQVRHHVEIEPTWKDWKAVPSGGKWQFLRTEANKTPQDTHLVMSRETLRDLPYEGAQNLEFFTLPWQLQVGQVGNIWGRTLHIDPQSKPNRIRFMRPSGTVLKIVDLQSQSVWEDK